MNIVFDLDKHLCQFLIDIHKLSIIKFGLEAQFRT